MVESPMLHWSTSTYGIPIRVVFGLAGWLCLPGALHAAYTFIDIVNPADPTFNQVLGITNTRDIVGYYGSGAPGHPNQGYISGSPYTSFTSLNYPGSVQTQAVGIDSSVVGFWSNTNTGTDANFGFIYNGATFTNVNNPLTPAGGTPVNQLLGVNLSNTATGFYVDASGHNQGYTYNLGTNTF